jgi:hypothetical protein
MVFTRGQLQKKAEDVRKTEAIPGEEDSTLARWPAPMPYSKKAKAKGGRGKDVNGNLEAVDWADLPDSCILRVFEVLAAEKASEAVRLSLLGCLLLLLCCYCPPHACINSECIMYSKPARKLIYCISTCCRCTMLQLRVHPGGWPTWRLCWETQQHPGLRGRQHLFPDWLPVLEPLV